MKKAAERKGEDYEQDPLFLVLKRFDLTQDANELLYNHLLHDCSQGFSTVFRQ